MANVYLTVALVLAIAAVALQAFGLIKELARARTDPGSFLRPSLALLLSALIALLIGLGLLSGS